MRQKLLISLMLTAVVSSPALAQFSDNKIVIGVMGDQSGVVADVGGPGSILAARMAVADFGSGSIDGADAVPAPAAPLSPAPGRQSLLIPMGDGSSMAFSAGGVATPSARQPSNWRSRAETR